MYNFPLVAGMGPEQLQQFSQDFNSQPQNRLALNAVTKNNIFYELVYGTPFVSSKAERVDFGQSMMTHAMVFTGVDLDEEGKPVKWRVENSWGEKIGDKGYLVMSDAWFEEYMYEVVVDKQFVPAEIVALLDKEPVVLPPWDPMGALAAAL